MAAAPSRERDPAPSAATPTPVSPSTRWHWTLHLLAFVLPLSSLGFLLTAPHASGAGWPWLLPLLATLVADLLGPGERRQPAPALPARPYQALVWALAAIQPLNVILAARLVGQQGFWDWHTLVAVILVGTSSGYSGIVVAHELVHRPGRPARWMARILMGSVLYDHFTVEHVRGHHVRVGTGDDPATARFGESFVHFLWRTVPGQLRSAWRLEARRLGDEDMPWRDPRLARSQVLHGLLAEWGFAFLLAVAFGWAAFFFHLLQASFAIRLLECVNYFEHWGLTRSGGRVEDVHSWDTDSWVTLYGLIGLSRHADHHAHAARPYQQLRHCDASPKLPRGYIAMVPLAALRNGTYRALMTEELRRRRLGPFAPDAGAEGPAATGGDVSPAR